MGHYIREEEEKISSLHSEERTFGQLKSGGSPLAQTILKLLSKEPLYSHEIAKKLKVHEQKIYYHIRKLEAAGLIQEERRQEVQGGSAKYYTVAAPSFTVLLKKMKRTGTISNLRGAHKAFLEPFLREGRADFLIVIGSPIAHGPEMVQARDGGYAIDLALFLGSFLSEQPEPVVKLDTEFTEDDWKRNLIIIGGPIVNTVAAHVNKTLPIHFENSKTILSELSNERYESDQIGLIVKGENPKAKGKNVLFIAGRRQAGTKAAILSFLKHFDELITGNQRDPKVMAHIVEGKDLDSDGIVDDLIFRE